MPNISFRTVVYFFIFLLVFFGLIVLTPPGNFPTEGLVSVRENTVSGVAEELAVQNVIRSPNIFTGLVVLFGQSSLIKAGSYTFERPIGTPSIVWRLVHGVYGDTFTRIRLPQGATRNEIADILSETLTDFSKEEFLEATAGKEGRLFPDTYFFQPHMTADIVAKQLLNNFDTQIEPLAGEIASSSYSLEKILIMASIIEREVADPIDRRIVSDVLWSRLELGMALQVDAPFFVLFGKTSSELTKEDLATTSPYNTYLHPGLPPTPIGNPGFDAIDAALNPSETNYLYYLSDSEGNTYFAEDFEGHQNNRELYLR